METGHGTFGGDNGIASLTGFLLCAPIGLAIWLIPLHYADTIGIIPAALIIIAVHAVFVVLSLINAEERQNTKSDSGKIT